MSPGKVLSVVLIGKAWVTWTQAVDLVVSCMTHGGSPRTEGGCWVLSALEAEELRVTCIWD